jgi:hypothetical protein
MGDGVAKMETPAFMPGRTSIFDLAVVCHNLKGRWGRHQRQA